MCLCVCVCMYMCDAGLKKSFLLGDLDLAVQQVALHLFWPVRCR